MDSSPDLSNAIAAVTPNSVPSQPVDDTPVPPRPFIIGFYLVAVLFNLCLMAQVLTVGLAYFYNPTWWGMHVWLVRGFSGLALILLVGAYGMPFSKRIRALTLSFPILLALQFLTIHIHPPLPFPLAIFHPLIGFSLFTASSTLVHRVGHVLKAHSTERQ